MTWGYFMDYTIWIFIIVFLLSVLCAAAIYFCQKDTEKLKIWIGFIQFIIGTVAVGGTVFLVNATYQHRQLESSVTLKEKELEASIELKELEQLGKYLEYVIKPDLDERMRFAEFFKTVSRSGASRERWSEYQSLLVNTKDELIKLKNDRDGTEKLAQLIEETRDLRETKYISKHQMHLFQSNLVIAKSPNGRYMAYANKENFVMLYDYYDLKTHEVVKHNDLVTSLTFSEDSQRLASAGLDNMMFVWNVSSRAEIRSFNTKIIPAVIDIQFSGSGSLNTLNIFNKRNRWDIESGDLVN